MKKGLLQTVVLFIVSLLMLMTSIFAWFSITDRTDVGSIVGQTANLKAELSFYVKRNDSPTYTLINTIEKMHLFFKNMVPSDQVHFMITIENTGNVDLSADVLFPNVESDNPYVGFDMRDIYYLKSGAYNLYENKDDGEDFDLIVPDHVFKPYEDIAAAEALNPVILFLGEEHEQELSPYRMTNITVNNHLSVLTNYQLAVNEKITLMFTIIYDEDTSHINYTHGSFLLNKIFIYIN